MLGLAGAAGIVAERPPAAGAAGSARDRGCGQDSPPRSGGARAHHNLAYKVMRQAEKRYIYSHLSLYLSIYLYVYVYLQRANHYSCNCIVAAVLLSSIASLLQKIQSSSKVLAQYSDQNYATAAELEATGLVGALAAQKRSVALFESVLCGRLRLLLSLAASPSLTAEHVALLDTAAADLGLGRPPGVEAQTAAQAAAGEEEGECSREHQLQSVSDTLVLYQKSPAQSNTSSAYADSSSILSSINALPSSAEAAGPANKRLRSSEEDDNDRKQPIVHISSPIEQRLSCEGAASPASSKASSRGGHASSQTESCPDAENVRPLTMYTPDNMLSTPAAASGSQQSPNLSSQEITI